MKFFIRAIERYYTFQKNTIWVFSSEIEKKY